MKNITVNDKLYLAEWVIRNNAMYAFSILGDIVEDTTPPTIPEILNAVCKYYSVSADDIKGRCRLTELVKARHIYLYICGIYNYRTSRVYLLVNRDHSTYSHAKKKIGMYVRDPRAPWYDLELAGEIADIMAQLKFRNHV